MESVLDTRATIPTPKLYPGKHPGVSCYPAEDLQRTATMTDATTNLQTIRGAVARFAREREWEQFHAAKNLSMAIADEAAELVEH